MKKILALVICLILLCSFSVPAFAAGATATLSGVPSEIKKDDEATVTVSLSGTPTLSSALVQVTLGSGLELVSGEWKKAGIMQDFTESNGYGVFALSSAGTLDGTVFSFVIKGKTVSSTAQSIKVDLTFNNDSSTVGTATASKTVKVSCVTHTYGTYTKNDNTNHTRSCSACGNVEQTNHTWNSGTQTKAPSCKETGVKTYTCTATGCGATKTETIAKTTNHTYGGWTTTKAATCTATGTQTRTCSVCGNAETKSISATGHSIGAWSQTKAPTCTAKGTEQRKCSKCSQTETRDVAATGHSYGSWTTTKEATCEAKGEQARTCSKCSAKETKAVNALGHKFSNPTVTKAPTCTETGIETGKCTVCKKETTNTIKALGHKFGEWTVKTAATCTEKGIEEHKCSVCEATENRDIEALGHDFEDPKTIKEPTISETGLKQGKCKICGQITEEVIPCTAKDETTGVVIETDKGVFQEGTELKVEEIKKENKEKHKEIKKALKEVSEKFVAYDISTVLNGAKVQPNGKIKVTFKIPEGFSNILKVFFIGDDGTTQEQTSKVNENGTITAELSHFSTYVICDMNEDSVIGANGNAQNNTLLIIIPIAAVVVIGGAVIIIVASKKKKEKAE